LPPNRLTSEDHQTEAGSATHFSFILVTMSTTLERDNLNACRQYQAYYDNALRKIGARAPQPIPGQDVNEYRAEVCRKLKRTYLPPIHDMYQVDYRALVANDALDTLKIFEPKLLAAVVEAANNLANVPPGELRKIEEMDEYGKVKTVRFVGDSFIRQFTVPGRHAHIWNDRTKEFYPPKRSQQP
jgi:hypothetical protein